MCVHLIRVLLTVDNWLPLNIHPKIFEPCTKYNASIYHVSKHLDLLLLVGVLDLIVARLNVTLETTGSLHLVHLLVERGHLVGPPGGDIVVEHVVNLLERLLDSLGVGEEDVEGHDETEDTEDDVGAPLDVGESRRDEESEGKVESEKSRLVRESCRKLDLKGEYARPVASGGHTDTLGSVLEREDLGGVDPGTGGPGETVDADKDVAEGNDGVGSVALDQPPQIRVAWVVLACTEDAEFSTNRQSLGGGVKTYHRRCQPCGRR